MHAQARLVAWIATTLLIKKFRKWALKGPKRPENSENMTFQKVDKSAPGKDSGRTDAWKILRG